MHEFSVNDPDSTSSKYPAVFEVASTSKFSKDDDVCTPGYRYRKHNMVEVETDFTWGQKVVTGPFDADWWGIEYSSHPKVFNYTFTC